jgi:hypothetical protein
MTWPGRPGVMAGPVAARGLSVRANQHRWNKGGGGLHLLGSKDASLS